MLHFGVVMTKRRKFNSDDINLVSLNKREKKDFVFIGSDISGLFI